MFKLAKHQYANEETLIELMKQRQQWKSNIDWEKTENDLKTDIFVPLCDEVLRSAPLKLLKVNKEWTF